MKRRISNTTEDVRNNPLIGLLHGMNIEGQERNGQSQLVNSSQLPRKWNRSSGGAEGNAIDSLKKQYELMGIKVIEETKGDGLFFDVELPEGWALKSTGHSMWNNLVDNKGRIRATIFYKAAFYDREAFINFQTRFSYNVIKYFSQEETGHFENKMMKVRNPLYEDFKEEMRLRKKDINGARTYINQNGDVYQTDYYGNATKQWGAPQEFINREESVWIPKWKNEYSQYKNTPHYYEIKDGETIVFSTKTDPLFFKRRHTKNNHSKWWADYDWFQNRLSTQAKLHLMELYPDHEDINAYWD